MSAFKKKAEVSQSVPTVQQMNNKLNLLLGLGSSQCPAQRKKGHLNRDLIMACAMFWDSKKRIDRIKSLILKQQQLEQFNSTQDFDISQLMSIELLSLSKNSIVHLQPITNLDTLVCLNINYNRVYDLSPISELQKLQQLYASNNQISHIDPLKSLFQLRILNLYSNKISRADQTLNILNSLKQLQELDIEENPVYTQNIRNQFLALPKLLRFNNQLILQQEKSDLGMMTESVIVFPTAKFRDTHTSLWGNKSQAKTATTQVNKRNANSKAQLIKAIQQLQKKYFQVDDKFEQQIVKNVQLKSQYHRKLESKKHLQRKVAEIKQKQEQINQLKRKVKAHKQNLYNNPESQRKGELLKELFQLQMMKELGKLKAKPKDKQANDKDNGKPWIRKFDFDQEIYVTQQSDDKYLMDEDEEIVMLLTQNSSTLQQIKRELRDLAN